MFYWAYVLPLAGYIVSPECYDYSHVNVFFFIVCEEQNSYSYIQCAYAALFLIPSYGWLTLEGSMQCRVDVTLPSVLPKTPNKDIYERVNTAVDGWTEHAGVLSTEEWQLPWWKSLIVEEEFQDAWGDGGDEAEQYRYHNDNVQLWTLVLLGAVTYLAK